jgi:hypothetical protein
MKGRTIIFLLLLFSRYNYLEAPCLVVYLHQSSRNADVCLMVLSLLWMEGINVGLIFAKLEHLNI